MIIWDISQLSFLLTPTILIYWSDLLSKSLINSGISVIVSSQIAPSKVTVPLPFPACSVDAPPLHMWSTCVGWMQWNLLIRVWMIKMITITLISVALINHWKSICVQAKTMTLSTASWKTQRRHLLAWLLMFLWLMSGILLCFTSELSTLWSHHTFYNIVITNNETLRHIKISYYWAYHLYTKINRVHASNWKQIYHIKLVKIISSDAVSTQN